MTLSIDQNVNYQKPFWFLHFEIATQTISDNTFDTFFLMSLLPPFHFAAKDQQCDRIFTNGFEENVIGPHTLYRLHKHTTETKQKTDKDKEITVKP